MDTLQKAILRLEPKINLLHDCLGFGRFAQVTLTSDGFFLGRMHGDIGFNHFLGKPSPNALMRSQILYGKLSSNYQKQLIGALQDRGIPPKAVGIYFINTQPRRHG